MQIGDMVVYIMQSLPEIGLIKDAVYEIEGTADCGGCKDGLHIDVGFSIGANKNFTVCGVCENIVNMDDRYFLHHSGFRLVETREQFIERHLEKIKNLQHEYKQQFGN